MKTREGKSEKNSARFNAKTLLTLFALTTALTSGCALLTKNESVKNQSFKLVWSYQLGKDDAFLSDVVVDEEGQIFACTEFDCFRLSEKDGSLKWSIPFTKECSSPAILARKNKFFVQTSDELKVLDPSDGSSIKAIPTNTHYPSGLIIANGMLYAETGTNQISALSLGTFENKWHLNTGKMFNDNFELSKIIDVTENTIFISGFTNHHNYISGIDLNCKKVSFTNHNDSSDTRYSNGRLFNKNYIFAEELVIEDIGKRQREACQEYQLTCEDVLTGDVIWSKELRESHTHPVNNPLAGLIGRSRYDFILSENNIFITSPASVECYDVVGRHHWTWNNRSQDISYIHELPDNKLLISSYKTISLFEKGDISKEIPTDKKERSLLIYQLVNRLKKLSEKEKLLLDSLGSEAVPLMIDRFGELDDKFMYSDDISEEEQELRQTLMLYIMLYGEPKHADQLSKALLQKKYLNGNELNMLCEIGAPTEMLHVCIKKLKHEEKNEEELWNLIQSSCRIFELEDNKIAVEYLMEVLRNREPEELMHSAYVNVLRNGGKKQSDLISSIRNGPSKPPSTKLPEWLKEELHITDETDLNPLAPARQELTDEEKILQAAFDARFRFTENANDTFVITLPKGERPIRFTGTTGHVLCIEDGKCPETIKRLKKEHVAWVNFGNYDSFEPKIYWSKDKTEAGISIDTYYGPLSSTIYFITLKKIDGEWFATRCILSLIS